MSRCRAHVAGSLQARVLEATARTDVDVLRATLQAWAAWMNQMKVVNSIFCYLDRSYLLPRHDSLHDRAVELFRDIVFQKSKLSPRIINGACDLVAADRGGKDLDKDAFDKAVSMFQDMHIYTKAFEPRLLHLSQQYMLSWADRESSTQTLGGYVKAVRTLMEKEMSRVDLFRLPGSTRRDLLMLMEEIGRASLGKECPV